MSGFFEWAFKVWLILEVVIPLALFGVVIVLAVGISTWKWMRGVGR